MYAFFSIFRTQPGIEPGHPHSLYPDVDIRNAIVTWVPQYIL